jgi:hypothetical protein
MSVLALTTRFRKAEAMLTILFQRGIANEIESDFNYFLMISIDNHSNLAIHDFLESTFANFLLPDLHHQFDNL